MPSEEHIQLERLLSSLCNETISDAQLSELNQILLRSAEARRRYCDYMDIHLSLADLTQRGLVGRQSSVGRPNEDQPALTNTASAFPAIDDPINTTTGQFPAMALLFALSAVSAIVALMVIWLPGGELASKTEFPSGSVIQSDQSNPASDENPNPLYLAQVVGMSDDVVWEKGFRASEFLLRMRRGDRIEFASGLVKLEYYSGAILILNGPCAFSLTGESSARLERGSVTGQVTEGDFILTTPTARVIDLGTEFGVSVDANADTSVCVFDGKVNVVLNDLDEEANKSVALTEGMSVRVDRKGKIDSAHLVDVNQFARTMPDELIGDQDRLSLADLFSAKSTSSYRLAGVIAPDTGESDRNPWLRDDGPGHRISNGYQSTNWHPFVDGVFIPTKAGKSVIVDSHNHSVDLPKTTGRTWGPVWSRRKLSLSKTLGKADDYWGAETLVGVIERLKRCEVGMIGIHANVGVTFDLDAVRSMGVHPVKFRTIVENLENSIELGLKRRGSSEWALSNRFYADFQIFVDGELRASRIDFTRADGELEIEVKLDEQDRFLTLVSTDGGGKITIDGFDHVVLVDPTLELVKTEENTQSRAALSMPIRTTEGSLDDSDMAPNTNP